MRATILLFLVSVGFSNLVLADPGFLLVTDPKVPKEVQKASASVFRFVEITNEPVYTITKEQYEETISFFEKEPGFRAKLMLGMVRDCAEKRRTICPLFIGRTSTAFLAVEKDLLFMARHSWETWAMNGIAKYQGSESEKFNQLLAAKENVKFALYNSQNQRVFYSGTNDKDGAYVEGLCPNSGMQQRFGWLGQPASDFARIRLSRPLNLTPLTFAKDNPAIGEKMFGISFPDSTKTRQKENQANDSDGISQYAAIGVRYPLSKFAIPFTQVELDRFTKGDDSKWLLAHDVDITTGSSGGPIFNKAGEVVANFSLKRNPDASRTDGLDRYLTGGANAISGSTASMSEPFLAPQK